MNEEEFLKLKNQIKEIGEICYELNEDFYELKNELSELSKQITEFNTPPVLDYGVINLEEDLI